MRLWLVALVACGAAPPQQIAAPDPEQPPPPPPPARPPAADATVSQAVEVPCGDLELAPPGSPACAPALLAKDRGVIAAAWEVPCNINAPVLRGDGAVVYGAAGGLYAVRGVGGTARPLSRRTESTASAAGIVFDLLATKGGQPVLAHGGHCEATPLPVADTKIAGGSDGSIYLWGRDDRRLRLMERASDASWRVYPPVREDSRLSTQMFAQGGRIVSSYRVGAPDDELGYYDDAHRLHPIRRGVAGYGLQVVPGEPPSALYVLDNAFHVEVADPQLGFRRFALPVAEEGCRVADGYAAKPHGQFSHHSQPSLFRTEAGGLWLAYGEWRGTCDYVKSSARASDPFLFAHPPPPPPQWFPNEIPTTVELVLVPVEATGFGEAMREKLPAAKLQLGGATPMPVVEPRRIRLAIATLIIDLDPARLPGPR